MNWQVGITAVVERQTNGLLGQTVRSISNAGFEPKVYIDENPKLRAFGHWMRTAWSMYILAPTADRYLIFQDDCLTYRNLRQYLEATPYPNKGYCNLYTYAHNEAACTGWHLSDQLGKGAVGLMFSNECLRILLRQEHLVERVQNPKRGHCAIDGGVVDAMKKAGWQEYVHSPSLLCHTGKESAIGNKGIPHTTSFKGEEFDALEFLKATNKRDASQIRVGLIGYDADCGTGNHNRSLLEAMPVEAWLVASHPTLKTREAPESDTAMEYCPQGAYNRLVDFARSVDLVLCWFNPPFRAMFQACQDAGRRLIILTDNSDAKISDCHATVFAKTSQQVPAALKQFGIL